MNRIPPPLSFRLGLGAPRARGLLPLYRGPRWLLLPSRSGTATHSHERPDGCATTASPPAGEALMASIKPRYRRCACGRYERLKGSTLAGLMHNGWALCSALEARAVAPNRSCGPKLEPWPRGTAMPAIDPHSASPKPRQAGGHALVRPLCLEPGGGCISGSP